MEKEKRPKIDNRTNKELILKTIKFMKDNSVDPQKESFFNLQIDVWDKLNPPFKDEKRRDDIRAVMLRGLLIHLTDNLWVARLTAGSLVAVSDDFNENGLLKIKFKEYFKGLWTGLIIAIAGAILTVFAEGVKDKYLSKPPTNKIELPKIQLVHNGKRDTIYLKTIK
jgi:hypothetical protein